MPHLNHQRLVSDGWLLRQINQRLSQYMRLYGYEAIDLPIIEEADIFLVKAGDQIANKLFTFEHHGRQLALRPEFTAAAVYHYLVDENQHRLTLPITRLQFSGYVFEDDPNSAQNQQRFSIGAEIFGSNHGAADAEIISLASAGLSLIDIHDWQLILGHVGLVRQILTTFQLDVRTEHFLLSHFPALQSPTLGKAFVVDQMDKLLLGNTGNQIFDAVNTIARQDDISMLGTKSSTPLGSRTSEEINRRLTQKRRRFVERGRIVAAIDLLHALGNIPTVPREAFKMIGNIIPADDHRSRELLSEWAYIVDLLGVYGVPENQILIQSNLARSWDYYTGVVFELQTQSGDHLGGGGRYDGLARLIGGKQDTPAVGFAYYIDEIIKIMPKADDNIQYPVTIVYDNAPTAAIRWAQILRNHSIPVELLPQTHLEQLPSNQILELRGDSSINYAGETFIFAEADSLIVELSRNLNTRS